MKQPAISYPSTVPRVPPLALPAESVPDETIGSTCGHSTAGVVRQFDDLDAISTIRLFVSAPDRVRYPMPLPPPVVISSAQSANDAPPSLDNSVSDDVGSVST